MSGFETVEQEMIKRNAVSSKDNPIASNVEVKFNVGSMK